MEQRTHEKISARLCGTPVELAGAAAEIERVVNAATSA